MSCPLTYLYAPNITLALAGGNVAFRLFIKWKTKKGRRTGDHQYRLHDKAFIKHLNVQNKYF